MRKNKERERYYIEPRYDSRFAYKTVQITDLIFALLVIYIFYKILVMFGG